ncbi:lipid droplet-associated protein [Pseudonocardia endophytica]|uniref:Lipid droplet-associated protein n=1 Tax=Pseudonocardia endophytica TaxID=401976 RepID=A0A4R1I260_PSEEN|nr:lipid droplet-associated protein [Pseudonocardia endophytica]TCK26569.1 hypothetical protein EV378_2407 [Pseudonocardia endophytica]
MSPLPYPVRIAAGLVVTAVEQARELPRHAVELPVTAVSQALQVSMRVQQKVTELAIKGDRALGTLRPADDVPAWATFDDDLPAPEPRNGASTVASLRPTVTEIPVERAPKVVRAPQDPGTDADAPEPSSLPEYPSMTIPQLRGKLRSLSVDDLSDLLAWETAHENRPAYVTMLTNRISTLSEQ